MSVGVADAVVAQGHSGPFKATRLRRASPHYSSPFAKSLDVSCAKPDSALDVLPTLNVGDSDDLRSLAGSDGAQSVRGGTGEHEGGEAAAESRSSPALEGPRTPEATDHAVHGDSELDTASPFFTRASVYLSEQSGTFLSRTSAALTVAVSTIKPRVASALRKGRGTRASHQVSFNETATVIEFTSTKEEREMRKPHPTGCCRAM